ncbi:hypothetical protein NQ318_007167 [Aromia moschata]|uniref:Glutaminyl-tRNA synthetase class Ib non-specific RNA-binding domain-containing protein n=1 Tax=Aromia moschata TaxID=1265417 RepID=A0AAV8XBL5_9CUCU|nr:hypothetical protein NQ318_007167 [Aromia moschata]
MKTTRYRENKKVDDATAVLNQGLSVLDVMRKVNFHMPGENFKTDGYVITVNTHTLLQEHLKTTGGKSGTVKCTCGHNRQQPSPEIRHKAELSFTIDDGRVGRCRWKYKYLVIVNQYFPSSNNIDKRSHYKITSIEHNVCYSSNIRKHIG